MSLFSIKPRREKKFKILERYLVGNIPTEAALHKHVALALTQVLKQSVVWTTIEVSTGQKGSVRQGMLKARGVKTGWPDIELFWPYGNYTKGLCIELKRKGNKATQIQLACHDELAKANIPTVICHSVDEVIEALAVYEVPTIITRS